MGVFNPTLDNTPAPEAPVQQPQGFSTAGALLNVGANLLGGVQKPTGPTEGELKRQAFANLSKEFDRAQQMEAQGNAAAARATRNKAMSSFNSAGFALTDTQADDLTERYGQDMTVLLHGRQEAQRQDILKEPEFDDAYALAVQQNPQGNPEEWENQAVTNIATQKALAAETAALAAQDNRQWNSKTRQVIKGNIDNFVAVNIGQMTLMAREGQVVSPEMLFASKTQWDQVKLNVNTLKPLNVPEKEWKALQEQMDAVDTFFESTINNSKDKIGLEVNQTTLAVASYLREKGAPKPIIAAFMESPAKFLEIAPDYFSNLLESTADLFEDEMETGSVFFAGVDITETTLPAPEEAVSPSLVEAVEVTEDSLKAHSAPLTAEIDFTDANETKLFEKASEVTAAALIKMARTDTLASQEFMQSVLSDKFMENVYRMSATNPQLSKKVLTQISVGIGEVQARMVSYLQTEGERQGIGVNSLGQVTLLPSAFEPNVYSGLMEAASIYYGGSVEAMLQDGGAKARSGERMKPDNVLTGGNTPIYEALTHLKGNTSETLKVAKGLGFLQQRQKMLENVRGVPQQPNVPDFVQALPKDLQSNSEFISGVQGLASEFNVDPADLVKIFDFETAGNFRTGNHGNGSSATGLIGFMADTAKEMGTSVQHLASLTQTQQLPYVAQYFRMKGLDKIPNPDITDVYSAVIWPAAMGKPDHYVLFSKGSAEYEGNKSLDVDGDGHVTRGDLRTRIGQYKNKGRGRTSAQGVSATGPIFNRVIPEAEEPETKELSTEPVVDTSAPKQSSAPPQEGPITEEGRSYQELDPVELKEAAKLEKDPEKLKLIVDELVNRAVENLSGSSS